MAFGTPRSKKEHIARDAIERWAYLLRYEMRGWVQQSPESSPEQVLEWATVSLLRQAQLAPSLAARVAQYAYLPFLESHERVAPHVAAIHRDLARVSAKTGKLHGGDATNEWDEDTEYLWNEYVHLVQHARRKRYDDY